MGLMECMRIGGSESEPKKINKDSEIILVKKIVKFFWKHKTLSLCLMMAIFLSYRFLFPNSIFLDRKDTLAQAILFWFFVAFFYIEAKKEEIKPRLSKLKLREYVIFLIPLSSSLLLFFFGVKYFDYETSLSFIITFAIAILIVFAFCALIGIVIFFYVSYPRVIYLFSKFFIFLFRHRIYKKINFKENKFYINYSKKGKIDEYIKFIFLLILIYFPIQIYFTNLGITDEFSVTKATLMELFFWTFVFLSPIIFFTDKIRLLHNQEHVKINIVSYLWGIFVIVDTILIPFTIQNIGKDFLYPIIIHINIIVGVSYGFLFISAFCIERILKSPYFLIYKE